MLCSFSSFKSVRESLLSFYDGSQECETKFITCMLSSLLVLLCHRCGIEWWSSFSSGSVTKFFPIFKCYWQHESFMQRLHIVGTWDRHFHNKSLMQHLRIVGVWACNFKKSNQARKVYSYILVGCCVRLEQQCFILRRRVFFHISVGCCICQLEIKSRFRQTIQNLTSPQNQKQNAIHLSADCWNLWNKRCIQPTANCYFH